MLLLRGCSTVMTVEPLSQILIDSVAQVPDDRKELVKEVDRLAWLGDWLIQKSVYGST